MKSPQIHITSNATDISTSYQEKDYELHSEHVLTCPDCNKNLVSILIVKKDVPIIQNDKIGVKLDDLKVTAKCSKCNQISFAKKFHRVKLFYKAIEPLMLSNEDLDIKKGTLCLTV